jgi:hypothetical protein
MTRGAGFSNNVLSKRCCFRHVSSQLLHVGRPQTQCCAALRCGVILCVAGQRSNTAAVLRFLQLLPADFANAATYNLALKACAVAKDLRSAMRVVDIMGIRQVPTDFIHFTTLIAGGEGLPAVLTGASPVPWAGPEVSAGKSGRCGICIGCM